MMTGDDIYSGHWVDYSKGAVRGQIITLSNQNARLLIAALALFAIYAGVRFWCKS